VSAGRYVHERVEPPLISNPDGISQLSGVAAKRRCHRQPRERAANESRKRAIYYVNEAESRAPLDGNS
jgi:hypothetical protein